MSDAYEARLNEIAALKKLNEKLVEALKAWEQWEAKLISDRYPYGAVEHMSQELLDDTTRVQNIRNAALAAANAHENPL